jgi:hypothetical protein
MFERYVWFLGSTFRTRLEMVLNHLGTRFGNLGQKREAGGAQVNSRGFGRDDRKLSTDGEQVNRRHDQERSPRPRRKASVHPAAQGRNIDDGCVP